MTDFIVFPGVDGDNVFEPEIRQAIAESPELQAMFAPSSGSENYVSATAVMALLASKLNTSEKGIALGLAMLDANSKISESNIPDRLSKEEQIANFVSKWMPNTFYPVDSSVIEPSTGDVVTSKSSHTSEPEYNPSFWKRPMVDGGTP